MGTTGVCVGEGAVRTAGGGVLGLPSPSEVGPEPLRTEISRSANFVAAGFGGGVMMVKKKNSETYGTQTAAETAQILKKV